MRQKFGTVEHKYIFSEIYNVSRDLSTSLAVQPKPKWKTNTHTPPQTKTKPTS